MTLFAVDPGLEGAFAVLDDDGTLLTTGEFPVVGTGANRRLALAGLADLVNQYKVTRAIVEDGQPMPHDGRMGAFRYGRSCGAVEGALSALRLPVEFVRPAVWKRAHHGRSKDDMRALAVQHWPEHEARFLRKKDHHRAESCLLGAWWLERHGSAVVAPQTAAE